MKSWEIFRDSSLTHWLRVSLFPCHLICRVVITVERGVDRVVGVFHFLKLILLLTPSA